MPRKISRYLFKVANKNIWWCDYCNMPILKQLCPRCHEKGRRLILSLPGDVRPAWREDLNLMRNIIDNEYGNGIGKKLLPDDKIILINKIPWLDRMEEIIVDGYPIGAVFFDLTRWRFMPKSEGAKRINCYGGGKRVLIDEGAVKAIRNGMNIMVGGIKSIDGNVERGDYVIVVSRRGDVVAVGKARFSSREIRRMRNGMAIKVKEIVDESKIKENSSKSTWSDFLKANKGEIEERSEKTIKFISKTVDRYWSYGRSISFSGGKDSACLLSLVLEAGIDKVKIVFLDTGIEFPETIRYIHDFLRDLNAENLLIYKKSRNDFWSLFERLGPPGRDYRWCCKSCKLSSMQEIVKEYLNGRCLTFLGQRKYESYWRAYEPKVAETHYIKGQLKVNPIRDWTALEVWAYIGIQKLSVNPLYFRNYVRIGCFLCPASDMADLLNVSKTHPDLWDKWERALKCWMKNKGFNEKWLRYGLWRWRNPPKIWKNLIG